MDKETLSNYGWIVIAVLVLVVMIALATPFGTFVSEAVQSTTKGLFDVNKSALDSTGLINIDNQEFDVPDMNHGAGKTPAKTLITFTVDGTPFQAEEGMTWGEWYESEYNATSDFLMDVSGGVVMYYPNYQEYFDTRQPICLFSQGTRFITANNTIVANGAYERD